MRPWQQSNDINAIININLNNDWNDDDDDNDDDDGEDDDWNVSCFENNILQ